MSYNLLVEACPWHRRAALFDARGRLVTLRYDEHGRQLITGALVWGRVRKVEPALGAAFVDIGDAVDGFLPLKTLGLGKKPTEGQGVMVRITRGSFAEKGARLSAAVPSKLPPPGAKAPQLVAPAPHAITRSLHDASSHKVTGWVVDARNHAEVREYMPRLNLLSDTPADFTDRLDLELDAMLSAKPTWHLAGGNVVVEMTSAVATIDINGGTMPGVRSNGPAEAQLALNLAAAEEVARLCLLLDLGGTVIVDFITPQKPAHRQLITEHLEASFAANDDEQVEVQRMSRAGLVEITRRRQGPSLTLLLKTPLYVAGRVLLELWRRPAGGGGREIGITCAPEVANILEQRLTREVCLAHLGRPVHVRADSTCNPVNYSVNS